MIKRLLLVLLIVSSSVFVSGCMFHNTHIPAEKMGNCFNSACIAGYAYYSVDRSRGITPIFNSERQPMTCQEFLENQDKIVEKL